MMLWRLLILLMIVLAGNAQTPLHAQTSTEVGATVVISELVASNRRTILDEEGDSPDWIELFNPTEAAVHLEGWFLTDDALDLPKWRLPAVTLGSGDYLLVFASGKDRAVAGQELHTNFKLEKRGEYLGLVQPDGVTVASEFAPAFPALAEDVSYGLGYTRGAATFVQPGSPCRVWIPFTSAHAADWFTLRFSDESWIPATMGLGYEYGNGYQGHFNFDVGDLLVGQSTGLYVRTRFEVDDPSRFQTLQLHLKFDDGFVAYLNGVEVARALAPESLTWDAAATASHDDSAALAGVDYDLTSFLSLLRSGENLLALQGLNSSPNSSDFLLSPTLEATRAMEPTIHRGFLSEASPGGPNTGVLRYTVNFSRPTGIYETGFQVSLNVVEAPGLEIRYTLDGTVPTAQNGLVYRDPLNVAANTAIRAAAVIDGQISTISEAHYFMTDTSMQSFSSDLPLVIGYSFGVEPTSRRGFVPVALSILEPEGGGRTRMDSLQNYHGCADLHLRGNNSAAGSTPKKQLKLSLCTANNENRNAPLLGMPADEDWILINPGNHDRSRLNNPIMFELGRACGEPWVSRYRFVEVFINTDAGDRSRLDYASDYRGIYILAERIKVHEDRVNITKMTPADIDGPAVTGGYIFKMDERCDSDEICFTSPMIQATHDGPPRTSRRIVFDTPDQAKLAPEQFEWMTRYLLRLESVLNSNNFRDPNTGYQAYIDRDSWIQNHLLHSAVNNVETSRKSIYYYKDRLGRLKGGPLWDFDWGLNKYGTSGWPFAYQDNWWGPLFEDPDFQMLWEDRWFALREEILSDAAMVRLIDGLGSEIHEAWMRDAARWPSYAQDYDREMDRLKTWFQQRFAWIDRQFDAPPEFQLVQESVDGPRLLTLSHPDGYAISYTLDGSDPRAPGGRRQPHATPYTAPILLPEYPVRVRARAEYLQSRYTVLTAQRQAVYWTDPIPLQVTEVQYDAPAGNAHEYLVLTNVGTAELLLRDYALRGDIRYDFSTGQTDVLAAGASLVVVKDRDTYPTNGDPALPVAGEYRDNLNDQGGCVDLTFHGEILQTFCY